MSDVCRTAAASPSPDSQAEDHGTVADYMLCFDRKAFFCHFKGRFLVETQDVYVVNDAGESGVCRVCLFSEGADQDLSIFRIAHASGIEFSVIYHETEIFGGIHLISRVCKLSLQFLRGTFLRIPPGTAAIDCFSIRSQPCADAFQHLCIFFGYRTIRLRTPFRSIVPFLLTTSTRSQRMLQGFL